MNAKKVLSDTNNKYDYKSFTDIKSIFMDSVEKR